MKKTIYEQIKKQNGEGFAKTIRNYDNGVFDIPRVVDIVKYAGRRAEPILPYLISLKNIKIKTGTLLETPESLLSKAGYNTYYVSNLNEQNLIQPYFAKGEALCTFNDPYRYLNYHIIHAVKKNVDQIKRSDFPNPKREDAYATSVISIQILKTGGFISIKNRYNHAVENCDNTFNSNPDNIIYGLSEALKKRFNVDFSSQRVVLPKDYIVLKEKIIHYQTEHNNVYIGDRFYVKDGKIYDLNPDFQLMIEGMFVLDLKEKRLFNPADFFDPFVDILNNEMLGKKISLISDDENGFLLLADQKPILKLNDKYQMTALYLNQTTHIDEFFLYRGGMELKVFSAPKLCCVESNFLYHNKKLKIFYAPHLEQIRDNFLFYNNEIEYLEIPRVVSIGNNFLQDNNTLIRFSASSLKEIGTAFLYGNKNLKKFYAPKLVHIRGDFIFLNEQLQHFFAKKLETVGDRFLPMNRTLDFLRVPNLRQIGKTFLISNRKLRYLFAPNLENTSDDFLENHVKRNYLLSHRKKISVKPIQRIKSILIERFLLRKER